MERKKNKWVVVTLVVILVLVSFCAVMSAFNWDFSKLSTVEFETKTYEMNADFNSIAIETDTADIIFAISDNGQGKVVCYEAAKVKHTVTVENGVLRINVVDERKWYEFIGITVYTPKITVYLPKAQYTTLSIRESTGDVKIPDTFQFADIDICTSTGDVKNYASVTDAMNIEATTGNILVENATADSVDLTVSTGKVTVTNLTCQKDLKVSVTTGKANLKNITCENMTSNGDTGDLTLENVIAEGKMRIERDTGDVRFTGCDAGEIFVETDTGDVSGTLLTDKVFIVESDTGRVDVPKTTTGGRCEITTDTGDINIKIS